MLLLLFGILHLQIDSEDMHPTNEPSEHNSTVRYVWKEDALKTFSTHKRWIDRWDGVLQ